MDALKITFRDPVELRLHPLQKALPDPDKTSAEWHSFVDGISACGPETIPPLICTREGLVMDGGRRWRAVKQLQWTQVPCIERPEHEAGALIVESLFGQRNWTRGAKAYVALSLVGDWAQSAEKRRLDNLRRGGKTTQKPFIMPKSSNWTSDSIGDVCKHWGVGETTFFQARRVRELLHEPSCKALKSLFEREEERMPKDDTLRALQKSLRDEFEPRLLGPDAGDKRVNLWNIESAIASRIKTEGQPRPDQLDFFGNLFSKFKHRAQAWDEMPKSEQKLLLQHWRSTVAVMPPELRTHMLAVLQKEEA
jgi:hypothetical protein